MNTYVQHVKDFKFWAMAAGLTNRIPEKETESALLVSKPDVFKEEMFS